MKHDEETLKDLMQHDLPKFDEDAALDKVLLRSARITATKDVASLFIGWIWIFFIGIGGPIHPVKRQNNRQQQINK